MWTKTDDEGNFVTLDGKPSPKVQGVVWTVGTEGMMTHEKDLGDGFTGTSVPTPADLMADRMETRLNTLNLTPRQIQVGNTIAKHLDGKGVNHRIEFADNMAVVLMNVVTRTRQTGEVKAEHLAYPVSYDAMAANIIKGLDETIHGRMGRATKALAPSQATLDKLRASGND